MYPAIRKKTLTEKKKTECLLKKLRWLEAAYLYYLHPEHDPLMSDAEWDWLGRQLEQEKQIESFGSLFQMKEADYPNEIREKYGNRQKD